MRVIFANIRDVRFNPIRNAQGQVQKNLTYALAGGRERINIG